MNFITKLSLVAVLGVIVVACKKDAIEPTADREVAAKGIKPQTGNEKLNLIHFGDLIAIRSVHTNYYVTGAWAAFNYDAWFVGTAPNSYELFYLLDPDAIASTAQLLTGDDVLIKSQQTGRYLTCKTDSDVACDATAISAATRWKIFITGSTATGYGLDYNAATSAKCIRSYLGGYLNYSSVYDAKATGVFDSDITPYLNPNAVDIELQ